MHLELNSIHMCMYTLVAERSEATLFILSPSFSWPFLYKRTTQLID